MRHHYTAAPHCSYPGFLSGKRNVQGYLIFVLVMSGILSSCNDCKTDPILIYVSKDAKAVGAFKTGTFWVYQNDSTLEHDSVIVTGFEETVDTIKEPCKDNNEKVINYKEKFITYTTSFFFSQNYIWTVDVGEPVLLAKENFSADTIYVDGPCIDTSFCRIIDTLGVAHRKYYNVYERIDSSSSLQDGRPAYFYSVLNLGIIKKQIINPDSSVESWSLVHSQIVQ